MADYLISREAAIKKLRGESIGKYPSSFYFGLLAAADELSKLPTVDAVEVVRCENCKKWEWFIVAPERGYCSVSECVTDEDDFCSYGERREENAAD